ncbi:acyloxyacyl hydrolase [Aquimarina intermedia]|uniref:Lipid A 3-O-deacylase PagL n=1 Tax=Aquimarina intermedia TaxID=350814 RepID=A0A5S5CD19_9FLAO|nr:acyloxyacyl hydrolase [Aquimarina intermedia]TYP77254.1 lipid A 3-O-deacylase PagL [Aquimarina intermedia]
MKYIYTFLILLVYFCCTAQNKYATRYYFDAHYFYGTILEHNPDISHLITQHPEGVVLSYNRKTYGDRPWEGWYNYPDYGVSFIYQDMQNEFLGDNYGLYGHMNFYFLKKNIQFRLGQGIAITTNPYDRNSNYINNAYGSRLLSSTYIKLNYTRPSLYKGIGLETGGTIIHYSNASSKAPNNSTNTFAFTVGLTYDPNYTEERSYIAKDSTTFKNQSLRFNLAILAGANETDVIGSGRYPFVTFSGYVDKRIGRKNALQLGADFFVSEFLKEYIKYRSIAFPEDGIDGTEDYKRVGLTAGHELFIGDLSVVTQIGYYVYYPVPYQGRWYNRLGLKYYFYKDIFANVTVKSHGATAEGVEFGMGIRL